VIAGKPVRILSINSEPTIVIPFLNAGRGPGGFYEDRLPIQEAVVDRLPDGVSAIIATADLQGRERFQDSRDAGPRLLGEALPSRLATDVLYGLGLNDGGIGVLLAGDLYTVPALDRRGGSGDVTAVWKAFGDEFAWVVGVPGNHDTFGADPNAPPRFSRHLHFLDNGRVNIDGLKIAGLGGIIGNPRRPRRRSEEQYAECLEALLTKKNAITLQASLFRADISSLRCPDWVNGLARADREPHSCRNSRLLESRVNSWQQQPPFPSTPLAR